MAGFTPVAGLVGGMLIGLATTLLLLFNGRIAGISGIVGGLLDRRGKEAAWRALFVVGLLIGAFVYMAAAGEALSVRPQTSVPISVLAGLLVGFGSRLGSGCTSGHGVSGIARLSRRSVCATVVFMATAMATVFMTSHVF